MNTVFLSFSFKNSSVSDFFIEMANQISKTCKVLIITDVVEKNEFFLSSDIEVLKWPSKRPTKLKDFLFLSKMVKKRKPHIMISNFGSVNLFLTVGFLFGVNQRIAWYHTLSGQLEKKPLFQFRKRIIYKLATLIVANSDAARKDLLNNFGVKNPKLKVVSNAIRDFNIDRETIQDKIIYVGRMHATKGVDVLLKAMPHVIKHFPSANLTLIGGNGKEEAGNNFEELVNSLEIQSNVVFLGNKTRDEVLEHFSSSYITIVPSIIEAFGYVIIESFSVKTPVIASNTTGIAEIVRNKTDGLLFEPKNYDELGKKIVYLLKNTEIRNKFSENCYQRFLTQYEITEVIRNFLDTLDINTVERN